MAWLYKRGGVWWMGWRYDGKQYLQSTDHTDKSEAQKVLDDFEELQRQKRRGTLTEDYFALLTGRKKERSSLKSFLETWLKESEGVNTPRTVSKYKQVVREFLAHTKAVETGMLLNDVTHDHLKEFFIWKRQKAASGTVAGFRRVLRSIFIQAQEEGKISFNPVQSANRIKNRLEDRKGEATRKRPFTLDEIKAMHERANPFWKFMIQVAFFTGMRMGDIVTLQRINTNMAQGEIAFKSRKTGKSQRIPMHPDLKKVFQAFPATKPEDYFWPEQAARYEATGASSLSQEFYELMASVGIVQPRAGNKKKSGKGRDAKREHTIIGFHNLRHTFVSMLKIGGAQDSVAKELAGHRSDIISSHYTHLPQGALSDAINQLPGVTK